ncbi:hypothetical protein CGLO_09597 [Colletotrichum gloeosporioides Cg-14]|uniref:Uncharacterized protein n=1 Tax=Colletotrichum gloeosporioides (strain Cg-14) TaxID=1237896 RepID=T0K609_COLGC|nr:hypothetical protein CGLO_09597 [Colletotrichum gloeosporioides Cg-14]
MFAPYRSLFLDPAWRSKHLYAPVKSASAPRRLSRSTTDLPDDSACSHQTHQAGKASGRPFPPRENAGGGGQPPRVADSDRLFETDRSTIHAATPRQYSRYARAPRPAKQGHLQRYRDEEEQLLETVELSAWSPRAADRDVDCGDCRSSCDTSPPSWLLVEERPDSPADDWAEFWCQDSLQAYDAILCALRALIELLRGYLSRCKRWLSQARESF